MTDTPSTPSTPNSAAPTPVPTPAPTPAPQVTPAATPAKPKTSVWKRLAVVGGVLYGLALTLIVVWGFALASLEITLFDYIFISQADFQGFLLKVFHVLMGGAAVALLLTATYYLFRSYLYKKEQVLERKSAKRRSMAFGFAFFLTTVLWLVGISFLGPKLAPSEGAGIITNPANTLNLTAPVTVEFSALDLPINDKQYSILSYTWNFGDGSTGNGPLISHRYTRKTTPDGRFSVVLNVEMLSLEDGQTLTRTFTTQVGIENETVSAALVASPKSGEIPLTVQFDGSSSYDPDGQITRYRWDLDGDGVFDEEGPTATYTYLEEGTFTVSLEVTDNNGQTNVATTEIDAGAVNGLRAVITSLDVLEGGTYLVGQPYQFSGEQSRVASGNINQFTWDFGDRQPVKSRNTTHTFEKAGEFNISLTITDQFGNADTAYMTVKVGDKGSKPSPSVKTTPAAQGGTVSGAYPLQVVFDATASTDPDQDIIEYQWDFDGDGVVDFTGDKTTHVYEEEGDFTATLTLVDAGGNQSTKSIPVQVLSQGLVARLEVDETNGEVPLTVTFNAAGSSYKDGRIVAYQYNFGDGGEPFVGGSQVTYRYSSVGTFTASVTVTADDGKKSTAQVQIVVRPVALSACFTVNSDRGNAPFFLSVSPACSAGTVKSYEWDFGDGSKSFDRQPEVHVYQTPGTYTVRLELTSEQGIVDWVEKTIIVE